ncbi:MAG TPA: hypothetical protein PLR38_10565 [Syntrophorhabdaceae bacterium]|nr:hypothetical protein [Syntrophorhabdaceae bacterium]HPP42939.1 hypothetical protein [Syntrophorhabdaceae bacterium]HQE80949.1 hypothetical protein [Syntrophorhabdaceae bacterium]HQH43983.1 hypothetical protein [Syntrophorhabdaceae bacterium]HRV23272.1 hypothetical protein [Syntrophorhabdaceae bacterium]
MGKAFQFSYCITGIMTIKSLDGLSEVFKTRPTGHRIFVPISGQPF